MLERIKSLDLPINEHVYASLVTGHARSGDMGGALQVMEMMKGNGLEPGVVTYTALLLAYAEKGDIEAIEKVRGGGGDMEAMEKVRGGGGYGGH